MMLDRWRFVARHLPRTGNGEQLIDVGCGSGAFTIGAAKRGYAATGLSWDIRNQQVAQQRALMVGAGATEFPIGDARQLDAMTEFKDRFDVVLSLENIEHIIDDRKLMRDLAACLKPGGRLILTTPNYDYRAVTAEDDGPFVTEETGWHVRRGYSLAMLRELADESGLIVEKLGSCSGLLSQKLTWLTRRLGWFGWGISMPLRIFPPILDRFLRWLFAYPDFSLTLVACKPRFTEQ